MENWAKLIDSIAGLTGPMGWPLAVVASAWLIMRRYREAIERLIDRINNMAFAGVEVNLTAAAEVQKSQVERLAEQVVATNADEEERREAAKRLAVQAEQYGRTLEAERVLKALAGANTKAKTWHTRGDLSLLGAVLSSAYPDDDDPPAAVPAGRPSK
jgi:hypothetical protein